MTLLLWMSNSTYISSSVTALRARYNANNISAETERAEWRTTRLKKASSKENMVHKDAGRRRLIRKRQDFVLHKDDGVSYEKKRDRVFKEPGRVKGDNIVREFLRLNYLIANRWGMRGWYVDVLNGRQLLNDKTPLLKCTLRLFPVPLTNVCSI